ncbi:MAG: hypothetical protein NUV59_01745 [Patescibacteria group bacterium]|nr:hypothetical protein [Patescibacteria group bacterium]
MMKKKIDIALLLIFPAFGVLFSYFLNINAFNSVMVFFGVPSLYLTIRAFRHARKAILFSLIASTPAIIVIDYIAQSTGQWIIPDSILPFRLLGVVTIEVVVWAVLNFYLVVMFYEHFLDRHFTNGVWYPRMKYLTAFTTGTLLIFFVLYFYLPTSLGIPYFYLVFGTTLILLPVVIQMFTHAKMDLKFFKAAAYFFYLTFLYEVTALQLGWWNFPSLEFIGWVSIFNVSFPIEELLFWLFLFAMAILSFYEFFDDDER